MKRDGTKGEGTMGEDMEVDASTEEADQTVPLERTLNSTTPAVEEGQAPPRQHTSTRSTQS